MRKIDKLNIGTYVGNDLSMSVPDKLDTHLRVLFQGQCNRMSAVEMRFDEVLDYEITPTPEGCDSIIYGAELSIDDNVFDMIFQFRGFPLKGPPNSALSSSDMEDSDSGIYISAKRISYRDVSNWMGNGLRYFTDSC
jgi:hypothetical protein